MIKNILSFILLNFVFALPQVYSQPYFASKFYPARFDAENIAVGHLNNDQLLDLIVVNSNGSLSISTNTGNGVFEFAYTITLTSNAKHVVAKDINNDNKHDMVIFGGSSLIIMTQSGSNLFLDRKSVSIGSKRAEHGQVEDINGDNILDIITANTSTNTISILTGTGQGSFGTYVDYVSGSAPSSVSVDDLNGDGFPDIAVSNYLEPSNRLAIFTNSGTGTFTLTNYYSSGTSPKKAVIVDVNNDQKKDIMIMNYNGVRIYRNNGNAVFTTPSSVSSGAIQAWDVATGDLNGDGYVDFVCPNFVDDNTGLVLNNGSGGFKQAVLINGFGRSVKSLVADLNNDGKMDFLTLSDNSQVGVAEYIQTNNVVIASNASKSYFDPNPIFVGTVTGTVNGMVSYQCAATQTSTIGTFVIYPQVDWSVNLWVATVPGKLTINKATVSVLGINTSKFYLEPNPPFTATVIGLRNNEVVNTSVYCPATTTSNPGNYTISVSRSGDPLLNYTVIVKNGRLSIMKLVQTITGFQDIPDLITFGTPYTITGVSSSANLSVGFFSSDNSVASLSNNIIYPQYIGTAIITAYSNGNSFYNSANYVTKVVRVVSITELNESTSSNSKLAITHYDSPNQLLFINPAHSGKFAIYTTQGQLVKEGEVSDGMQKIHVNLARGLYLVKVNENIHRIVVE